MIKENKTSDKPKNGNDFIADVSYCKKGRGFAKTKYV